MYLYALSAPFKNKNKINEWCQKCQKLRIKQVLNISINVQLVKAAEINVKGESDWMAQVP
jgi:hypothetical protein